MCEYILQAYAKLSYIKLNTQDFTVFFLVLITVICIISSIWYFCQLQIIIILFSTASHKIWHLLYIKMKYWAIFVIAFPLVNYLLKSCHLFCVLIRLGGAANISGISRTMQRAKFSYFDWFSHPQQFEAQFAPDDSLHSAQHTRTRFAAFLDRQTARDAFVRCLG